MGADNVRGIRRHLVDDVFPEISQATALIPMQGRATHLR